MAFTAKILSWRFRHLNIVGCLLKRRPTKGGSRAPQDPPSYAPAWTYNDKFSFLSFNLNKILKNSIPGIVACIIWHIERVQIDAIKSERMQIHFFSKVFTAFMVVVA